MLKLSAKEMDMLANKLDLTTCKTFHCVQFAQGCPNCNGQCKNGCGVTCVSILS